MTATMTATITAAPAPQPSSTNDTPITLKGTGKRAAQDALPAAPTKCPRFLEPSSINGILRQYARQRLYVQPLHWTAQHLRLLGCVFIAERRAAGGKTEKKTAVDESQAQSVATAATYLEPGFEPEIKATAIWHMLRDHGLYKACTRNSFELRFAQRSVNAYLHTNGMFAPSAKAPAALAFLDLDAVAKRRDESITMPTNNRMNPPVARIRRKKQARIRPIDELHDPYIAAVLIGLAQAQRHAGTPSDERHTFPISTGSDSDSSINILRNSLGLKVYLLATTARSLHIYTAYIPLTFLDRLDQPSQHSFAETVPLYHHRLPLNSPTKVSRTIDTIAKSMGRGPLYLDSIQLSQPELS